MTKDDLVEFYKLGDDAEVSSMTLYELKRWAAVGVFKLGCLTTRDKYGVWYVGFDRPLTNLMKNNLFTKTGRLLNQIDFMGFED